MPKYVVDDDVSFWGRRAADDQVSRVLKSCFSPLPWADVFVYLFFLSHFRLLYECTLTPGY
jgi:hypothetical protein